MENCSNLFVLSTIACKLAACLSEKELTELSADLVVLSDMLANILVRRNSCEKERKEEKCVEMESDVDTEIRG